MPLPPALRRLTPPTDDHPRCSLAVAGVSVHHSFLPSIIDRHYQRSAQLQTSWSGRRIGSDHRCGNQCCLSLHASRLSLSLPLVAVNSLRSGGNGAAQRKTKRWHWQGNSSRGRVYTVNSPLFLEAKREFEGNDARSVQNLHRRFTLTCGQTQQCP